MKQDDKDFLNDLAERLMHVPVMYGTDQGDTDRLSAIANSLTSNPAGKVAGYTAQPDAKVALVNEFKADEERLLRKLDQLQRDNDDNLSLPREGAPGSVGKTDHRWFAIARTHFQEGFMALNRAVFQPQRIRLPEDDDK